MPYRNLPTPITQQHKNQHPTTNLPTTVIFTLILLSSCQHPAQSKTHESKAISIGQEVTEWDTSIWAIYQDKDGVYWFGSNGKGLFRYDGAHITRFSTEDGLAGNQIRDIQEDAQGQIIIQCFKGISVLDGERFRTLEIPSEPSSKWTSSPRDLWFKGSSGQNGAIRYDGDRLHHHPFPEQDLEAAYGEGFHKNSPYSPYEVFGIDTDKDGNIWFGTESAGVFRYDGDSLLWIAEKELTVLEDGRVPGVRSMVQDKNGHYWLSNILHRYEIHESTPPASAPGGKGYDQLEGIAYEAFLGDEAFPYFMSAVTDDVTGDLWMLTYSQGVWRFDEQTLTVYPILDGERPVNLIHIYKDRGGTLWLGTADAGVYRMIEGDFIKFEP